MTFGFGNQHSIQLSYGRPPCILRIARGAVHFRDGVPFRCRYARAIMRASRYGRGPRFRISLMSDEHSSFIKTPKQLAHRRRGGLCGTDHFGRITFATGHRREAARQCRKSDPQLASRIKPFGEVTIADASARKGNLTGEQVFQAVCKTCHEPGIAGAPKVGDKASWAVPIKKGYDTLLQHAINGFQEAGKVMPPKGGNPDLTDVEVAARGGLHGEPVGREFQGASCACRHRVDRGSGCRSAGSCACRRVCHRRRGAAPSASVAGATPTASPAAPGATANAAGPLDLAAAQAMMQKDGCGACHSVDKKIVGPAYQRRRGKVQRRLRSVAQADAKGQGGWRQASGARFRCRPTRTSPTATSKPW